ncbi:hypothetical protein MASR2M29_20340 [Spirochaetota bacterium]
MPRPISGRRIRRGWQNMAYKPAGLSYAELEELSLGLDEAEAIRLADLEGLYHEAAARRMGISRQTFGRILVEARRIVADAILNGKALRIGGGQVIEEEEHYMYDKVAVPTRGGMIDEHFGHCEYFTVFSIENDKVASEKRVDSPDGCGCKTDIASVLARDGVKLMLAGNMGEGAVRVLKANGIEVVRGASGKAREAVEDWLLGRIRDSGKGCSEHSGHDCSH